MKLEKQLRRACQQARAYRITDGATFRLKDWDPEDIAEFGPEDKPQAEEELRRGIEVLARMQDLLYAQDSWALLLIFQAMDAAGKDGVIKHVMSGLNPQGCQVVSFKAPSATELDHDYLWRCARELPQRGRIGIFNRSYYEEVLVVRVHQELLRKEKLPDSLVTRDLWKERCRDICHFESYLAHNGVVVRKFFLNLSRREQKQRFLERIDNPAKNWKFSASDAAERGFWKEYMAAYQEMIRRTATPGAPWYVVPADHKWYTRMIVAAVVIDTLASLNLRYPKLDPGQHKELAKARRVLMEQK